jgi:sulfotransferase
VNIKKYFFMAGMPRSGSTVLASILNQHPFIYATPTSPLLDLLFLNDQHWNNNPSVVANRFPQQQVNIAKIIIRNCWAHRKEQIIIDKHRAWGKNLWAIQNIFEEDPKLIVTVRDVPSVIASFFTLLRRSQTTPTFIDKTLLKKNMRLNDENRADCLWNDYIQDPWISFKMAWDQNKSALHLVQYDDLVNNKQQEIDKVYKFLKLPQFKHDFENIKNDTVDDDLLAWGIEDLHTIRPSLNKTSKDPEEILGHAIFKKYHDMKLEFWNE